MNLPQKIIQLPTFDPVWNLTWEQLYFRADLPVVLLWRSYPAVILGRHQIREDEVEEAAIARRHIRVVQRITGGGAVYMDLGNLNIGIVAPAESPQMPQWTALFSEILRDIGVAATSEHNDILVNGRKVSGWAESLVNGFSLAHGTMMFDVNLDTLNSVLRPQPEKLNRHGIASVRQRVVNLKEYLPDWAMQNFISEIKRQLSKLCL